MNDPTDFLTQARLVARPEWRATHPLEVLALVNHMTAALLVAQVDAVRDARTDGETWEEIGEAMGTSRQGAFNFAQRWLPGRLPLD